MRKMNNSKLMNFGDEQSHYSLRTSFNTIIFHFTAYTGKAKSAAGLKSIASASDAHLEEISTMTPVNAGLATINALIMPSGNSMAPNDAPEKLDKQRMAIADNIMPDDTPMAPEVDEMPPPDYNSVVQSNT